ncbi:MAG: chorismate-binding protein, partial [Bacteroidota bacterium]|nr:chorismate-binding protein [Bacteroidota bacterium]
MLSWAKQFNIFCFLDNHQYQSKPHSLECMLAIGVVDAVQANVGNALEQLQKFIEARSDRDGQTGWLFGHLSYDLKNEIEYLHSSHIDNIKFPDLFFFQPKAVISLGEKEIIIEAKDPANIFQSINETPITKLANDSVYSKHITIQSRISKKEYIRIFHELQQHILRGDCYEINFCQEFFAEDVSIDPVSVYKMLSTVSPNPFSALYKLNDKFLICASPERFLKKQGNKILSQPIKGTSKRMISNGHDNITREELLNSSKDRSENVMVVDLVRNDLSKVSEEGSVNVEELFGIYSFPQVHQMISTISGKLKKNISFIDIIRATYPMGSMT